MTSGLVSISIINILMYYLSMKKSVVFSKVFLGADHAGYKFKERIKKYLENKNIDFVDLGSSNIVEGDDYDDYAKKVCAKVAKHKDYGGILICGSGVGMAMAANRYKSIRAVAAYDIYTAQMSRSDEDSNVLALRSRFFSFTKTKRIIDTWLSTKFSAKPRHIRRIKKLNRGV